MDDNPFIYFLLIEQYVGIQNYDRAYEIILTAENKFGKHRQLLLLSALVYGKKGIWLKSYHCFVVRNLFWKKHRSLLAGMRNETKMKHLFKAMVWT